MAWEKPAITEIAAGMEINSYACADLKEPDRPEPLSGEAV